MVHQHGHAVGAQQAFGISGVLLIAAGVVALQLPRKGFTLMATSATA